MIAPTPGLPKQAPTPAPATRPTMTPTGIPAAPQPGKTRRDIESGFSGSNSRAPSHPQDRKNLSGLRKTSLLVLGKHQLFAQRDVEHAAPSSDQLYLQALFAVEFRLQTGGARQVISAAAVLYDNSGNGPYLFLIACAHAAVAAQRPVARVPLHSTGEAGRLPWAP